MKVVSLYELCATPVIGPNPNPLNIKQALKKTTINPKTRQIEKSDKLSKTKDAEKDCCFI